MKLHQRNLSMAKENTFIRVYNSAIDLDYCDSLIEKFESHSEQHERMNTKDAKKLEDGVYVRGSMLFHELHLWKYMDTWKEDVDKLASIFTKNVDDYKSQFSAHCIPKDKSWLSILSSNIVDKPDVALSIISSCCSVLVVNVPLELSMFDLIRNIFYNGNSEKLPRMKKSLLADKIVERVISNLN